MRTGQLDIAEAMLVAVQDQFGPVRSDNAAELLGIGELLAPRRLLRARRMMQEDDPKQSGVAGTPQMIVETFKLLHADPAR